MTSFLDRVALGLIELVPNKVAHHLMFLAQSRPEIPDGWGYHIRPIHYYEPLPDFRTLTTERVTRRRDPVSIDFDWEHQLSLLRQLSQEHASELRDLPPSVFNFDNEYFAGFDAAVYYSLIRHLTPNRVIEIGSGYSTRIAHEALNRNSEEGRPGTLTCVEPNPDRLTGQELQLELIETRVEEIPLAFFSCLDAGDILFIDSSHTVKFGSDVCYELLEILPSLKSGVWVHVHDIFFPHDYPAEWLLERRLALNEQYLLEAFLAYSKAFSVELANHWLSLDHPNVTSVLWDQPHTKNMLASSLWMSRI
ncbi:MAG TPA: class I SAM-dependent methyltransferase [Pyrinomonadaceae bacterium]|nr:class I SAM-dependent methyltransferase [Pyrinomonadaceae bacterium]